MAPKRRPAPSEVDEQVEATPKSAKRGRVEATPKPAPKATVKQDRCGGKRKS